MELSTPKWTDNWFVPAKSWRAKKKKKKKQSAEKQNKACLQFKLKAQLNWKIRLNCFHNYPHTATWADQGDSRGKAPSSSAEFFRHLSAFPLPFPRPGHNQIQSSTIASLTTCNTRTLTRAWPQYIKISKLMMPRGAEESGLNNSTKKKNRNREKTSCFRSQFMHEKKDLWQKKWSAFCGSSAFWPGLVWLGCISSLRYDKDRKRPKFRKAIAKEQHPRRVSMYLCICNT